MKSTKTNMNKRLLIALIGSILLVSLIFIKRGEVLPIVSQGGMENASFNEDSQLEKTYSYAIDSRVFELKVENGDILLINESDNITLKLGNKAFSQKDIKNIISSEILTSSDEYLALIFEVNAEKNSKFFIATVSTVNPRQLLNNPPNGTVIQNDWLIRKLKQLEVPSDLSDQNTKVLTWLDFENILIRTQHYPATSPVPNLNFWKLNINNINDYELLFAIDTW